MSYNWGGHGGEEVELEKDIDVEIDFDLEVDVDIDIEKDVDIDANVDVCVDVSGNLAELVFDVEAVGKDTYAQADVTVIAIEDTMSHASGYMVAGVA